MWSSNTGTQVLCILLRFDCTCSCVLVSVLSLAEHRVRKMGLRKSPCGTPILVVNGSDVAWSIHTLILTYSTMISIYLS